MKTSGSWRTLMLFVLAAVMLSACSDGGGSVANTATLQGKVADGYVAGATVELYAVGSGGGLDVTRLATGATDANGDFVLFVPETDLPEHMAFLSRGGTIIDTGMPAPTMIMTPLRDRNDYNVTPLTDFLVRSGMRPGSSFFDAEERLSTALGLSAASLYDDPLTDGAPAALKDGLYRSLAGGDRTVSPADGGYRICLIYLDKNDIGGDFGTIDNLVSSNYLEGTLTISNGEVSGTLASQAVSGRIRGPNLLLSVAYDQGVTNIAGTLGLLGSISGSYVDLDASGAAPALSTGVFVAALIPQNGIDAAPFLETVQNLYDGRRNALFRDLYGDRDLGWGIMGAVNIIDSATLTTGDFQITLNAAGGETGSIRFDEGRLPLCSLDSGMSGLAVMRFKETAGDTETDYAYLIQALGNRRGIYVAGASNTGSAYAIGESYLARSDAIGGRLEGGKSYDLYLSAVSPHMIGQPRDPDSFIEVVNGWTVPAQDENSISVTGSASAADGVRVISGSLLGAKVSSGTDGAGTDAAVVDTDQDMLAVAEIQAVGAIQGDRAVGGTLQNGADAADWSVPFVGYARPAGDVSTYSLDYGQMQLDFLARPIYVMDLELGAFTLENYRLAWIEGGIEFHGQTAVLTYRDAAGETGRLELSVDYRGGLYHMYGKMGENEYFDILWPGGGTRAVYVASVLDGAAYYVYEIGEAFITY